MKELTEIDNPIITFTEAPVTFSEMGHDGKPKTIILTRKLALLNCLGSMKVENGLKAIEVYSIGTLLHRAKNTFKLTNNSELELLKKAVEQNNPGYMPFIQGQLLQYLEETKSV